MSSVIFSFRVSNSDSETDISIAIKRIDLATQLLNKYRSMGEKLLKESKRLKKINTNDAKKYQKVIRKKEKEIIKILENDCKTMGLPLLEEYYK